MFHVCIRICKLCELHVCMMYVCMYVCMYVLKVEMKIIYHSSHPIMVCTYTWVERSIFVVVHRQRNASSRLQHQF